MGQLVSQGLGYDPDPNKLTGEAGGHQSSNVNP